MTAVSQSPQAMFGVLIALERGTAIERLAGYLGGSVDALLDAVDAARAGNGPRQGFYKGERMVSEVTWELSRVRAAGQECFLTPWYRTAIEMLARENGALTGELADAAASHGRMTDRSKLVSRCIDAVRRAGFAVEVRINSDRNQAHYQFSPTDRLRMLDVIANGWVIEVAA